jgi:hypothetical protein
MNTKGPNYKQNSQNRLRSPWLDRSMNTKGPTYKQQSTKGLGPLKAPVDSEQSAGKGSGRSYTTEMVTFLIILEVILAT